MSVRADRARGRPAPRRGRLLPARVAAAAALLALVAALALAGPAAATYSRGDDWRHVESTLEALGRRPPAVPVVVLLGGSAARECITTEPAWRAQIATLGGGRVRALNFGSSSQSFKNDLSIVNALPPVPTVVLIGLNVGRYTSIPPPATPPAAAPGARAAAVYDAHRFHVGDQLSDAAKRQIVRTWLAVKYPRFRERYAGNAGVLRELITLCRDRDFFPVLVELPLNLPVVRHSWDAARDRYRRGARTAALSAGIPYVDFVANVGLVSSDFVDVCHLVESGRAKYQRRLSRVVVTRLRQYGLAP
jgi:hypothetical protein